MAQREKTSERGRGVPWTEEETILAIDLHLRFSYSRKKGDKPSQADKEKLSREFASYGFTPRTWKSVHFILANCKSLDLNYTEGGKRVGLKNASPMLKRLWEGYKCNTSEGRENIAKLAQSLREELKKKNVEDIKELHEGNYVRDRIDGEEVPEAIEGRLKTVTHINRERDPKLRKRKIEKVLDEKGSLSCEACDFDFAARYGDHGDGFIEVHHTQPLATLTEASRITLDDLALLCSNCHRMVHRKKHHWLTMDELCALVQRHNSKM